MNAFTKYAVDPEPGDEVFCECCEKVRTAKQVDVGYGPTEFWGSWANHVDLQTVCDYCESADIRMLNEMECEE